MITDTEFVDIWQQAKNLKEIETKTGMGRKAIYKRASRYRRSGIPLKYFRLRSNVAELIKRAENLPSYS